MPLQKSDLKLYVWEDVLQDYTSGMMVALAHNLKEARALLRKECGHLPDDDLESRPKVIHTPRAFVVWGGG